jgi:hypothetical protein
MGGQERGNEENRLSRAGYPGWGLKCTSQRQTFIFFASLGNSLKTLFIVGFRELSLNLTE